MQADRFAAGEDTPGVGHHVLLAEHLSQTLRGDAQAAHLAARDFHLHLFLAHAGQADLAHPRQQHQLTAQVVGEIAQFLGAVALAGEQQEEAEYIAEIIPHLRRVDPRWQVGLQVVDLAPQFIPDLRDLLGLVLAVQFQADLRQPGTGDGGDLLDRGQLLDGVLQRVADLFFHLLRRGAGIAGDDHGVLQGEGRVFQAADSEKGQQPADAQHQSDQPAGDATLDKVAGDIHLQPSLAYPGPYRLAFLQLGATHGNDLLAGFDAAEYFDAVAAQLAHLDLAGRQA